MDLLAFLIIVFLFIGLFKVLGFFFKAAFFLISIPLQILAAVIVAVIFFAIFPVALLSGLLGVILLPLGLLAPLLPVIIIALGIYLLARR